jgi:transcription elongation factor GreB
MGLRPNRCHRDKSAKLPTLSRQPGLRALHAEFEQLMARRGELLPRGGDRDADVELRHVDRDLEYVKARIESAIPIEPSRQPQDRVAFGAVVAVREGRESSSIRSLRTYAIVGEDEADAAAGKASYVSSLATALVYARVGETVTWRRPAGDLILTVERIDYS